MFTDQGAEAAGKNQVAKVLIDRKHLVLVIDHFTGHSSKEPKSRLDINRKSDPALAEVALGVFTIARLRLFLIGPALRFHFLGKIVGQAHPADEIENRLGG